MSRVVITITLLIFLQGCSSIGTIAANKEEFDCEPEFNIPRIYSGVANDIRYLRSEKFTDEGIVILDLPFSFVADTIALPYTIYTQIRYGNLCNKSESCCN